jgi:hypothetical protein
MNSEIHQRVLICSALAVLFVSWTAFLLVFATLHLLSSCSAARLKHKKHLIRAKKNY